MVFERKGGSEFLIVAFRCHAITWTNVNSPIAPFGANFNEI